jgi:hypothetical protein
MNPTERDIKVAKLMEDLISEAKKGNYEDSPDFVSDLEKLFSTTAWGFREITLVIGIASLLFDDYKASTGFYSCNPRPLYEQSIRNILIKYKIPHRKSGPLNVAKATQGINSEWAAQRRPKEIAESVVNLVNLIERYSKDEIRNLMIALVKRLLDEATRVENIKVETDPKEDPIFLFKVCKRLIDEATDGGNTPQRIIGYLLEAYHDSLNTGIIVSGHEDRASTTNTTSKKPGDIQEESLNEGIISIFEVTVKPFNEQRINDSFESVIEYDKSHGTNTQSVLVICRRQDCPQDMETLNLNYYLGKIEKGHVSYYFIDIYEWIMAKLISIPAKARMKFHSSLNEYISHPNTSEKVKLLWKKLHEDEIC